MVSSPAPVGNTFKHHQRHLQDKADSDCWLGIGSQSARSTLDVAKIMNLIQRKSIKEDWGPGRKNVISEMKTVCRFWEKPFPINISVNILEMVRDNPLI